MDALNAFDRGIARVAHAEVIRTMLDLKDQLQGCDVRLMPQAWSALPRLVMSTLKRRREEALSLHHLFFQETRAQAEISDGDPASVPPGIDPLPTVQWGPPTFGRQDETSIPPTDEEIRGAFKLDWI